MVIPGPQDGSVQSCNLKSTDLKQVVPTGTTFNTSKQLVFDSVNRKISLCDREGLKIIRCGLDGSQIEDFVITGDTSVDVQKMDQMR